MGQIESDQFWHAVSGGRVERRLLAIVLPRMVDVGAFVEREKEEQDKDKAVT